MSVPSVKIVVIDMLRNFSSLMLGVACLVSATAMHAQTLPRDPALKPPPGAHVAIVEFADLECPRCGKENPVIKDVVAKYRVPWVRHDFPLRQHVWSFQAAVNGRWFDTKGKNVGDDYRDAVFANQINIENLDGLRAFTEKFAQERGIALPFAIDPQNKLSDAVKADYDLGMRLGVHQTPTAWVVTSKGDATEVSDFTQLSQMVESAQSATKTTARK